MDSTWRQLSEIDFYVPKLDVKGVFGCIFTQDKVGNILILLMKRTAQYPEQYVGVREFPGGGIMEAEGVIQALIRELDEEIGLFDKKSFVYQCKFWSYSMIRLKKDPVYLFFLYIDKEDIDLVIKEFVKTNETDDPKLYGLENLNFLRMTPSQKEFFVPIVKATLIPFNNNELFSY